jgi:O-antigen ligase
VLPPSEGWLVVGTALLVVYSSWAFGGSFSSGPTWILALVLLSCPLLLLRYSENRDLRWRPFIAPLSWIAYSVIAVLNPSHTGDITGGWLPRADWIQWLPTTADIGHTLADARLGLAALLEGALLVALLRERRATRLIWSVVALNGCALAVAGAFFRFANAEKVLGLIDPPEPTYFFATFFYKNHWAAYGALSAIAAFGLALEAWPAALAGDQRAKGRSLFFSAAGLLIAITLPLPGSRAGALLGSVLLVSLATTMIVLWWRAPRRRRSWIPVGVGVIGIAVIAFGVNANAPHAIEDVQRTRRQLERSMDGNALDLRISLARDTWRMAKARPWFGWGPGCFEIVFPVFQGAYLRGADGRSQVRFEAAHNDWLQILAENGVIGGALLVVPALLLGWHSWRKSSLAGRWGLAGCGLIACYAAADFPFHNPAVLMLWTVMVASAPGLRARHFDG